MLVVHGVWGDEKDNVLCLWAEDTDLPPPALPPQARSRDSGPRPHPAAVPAGSLPERLWNVVAEGSDLMAKAAEGEITLQLPGGATSPRPSPETGRQVAGRTLAGWRIPVLKFGPDASLELLETIEAPDEEIVLGADLRYLVLIGNEAINLRRRGRVLPGLVTEDGAYAARWRPILAGAEAARFQQLVTAMPPVCRAGGRPGAHLLIDALTALTDAAVRRSLTGTLSASHGPSATEHWIAALTRQDARVRGTSPDELDELSEELERWFGAAYRLGGTTQVCFQLHEPEPQAADEDWRIEFAVQSADDPSLIVPAAKVWAGEPGLPARSEDTLLAGLGHAARLFPALTGALRESRPSALRIGTDGALTFLRDAAPLLRAAGFGVRMPAWAGRTAKARLGLKLTTSTPSETGVVAGAFGLDQLVDFRWDVAVGDDTLDPYELAELSRLKIPLVRLRGQWVELDERQLAAALNFVWGSGASGTMTEGEVVREIAAGGPGGLPIVDVDADGRLGDLLSGEADRRLAVTGTPAGFDGTLRPYQERGLAWLNFLGELGLGGILADDMGLGKTAQTLALLLVARRPAPATLLVCPMSVVGNWQREAARFAPELTVYVHHGGSRRTGEELAEAAGAADLVITTYGTLLRDQEALAALEWARVVCDEAQALKNSATRQARAVRAIKSPSRIALTGTPVENHLGELWSIMEFTNPGLLGAKAEFRRRYAVPIERDRDPAAAAALKRATQPFVLRRLKTDRTIISDLPEKMEMKAYCNLTREQASLYQATVDDMIAKIEESDGIERKGLVLATMAKLKQVCNHPAHLLKDGSRLPGRSGKLTRLEEILAELLDEGDKALCFTQYAEFGTMLQPYLAARLGRPVLWLHGGTSRKQRDALMDRFQAEDEPAVFLLSLKAAGTGLNLTAANHVIHVDRWWNPAVEDQATDRAFRIGQTKNVQVRKFVCAGTLEERIDEMIESKKALAESIVGTGEDWLTELSVAELRDVIRLSPEAVS